MSQQDLPPIHDVDIRLLRVFKAVVEHRGFAAAEEALGVGRSTISKHISDLEARLSIRLCDRGRAGFTVTPYGQAVYKASLGLLDALDQFRSEVSTAKGRLVGEVALWVMDNTQYESGNPVANALRSYGARPGDITVNLTAASPEAVEEALVSRRANVGVTIAKSEMPGLSYWPVGREATSLYCATEHPIAAVARCRPIENDDLSRCDFVTRGYLRSEPVLRGRRWTSRATAFHVEANLQFIISGGHLGILPDHIARPFVEAGRLICLPVPEARGQTTIYVACRSQASRIPVVSALVEDIKSSYRAAAGS